MDAVSNDMFCLTIYRMAMMGSIDNTWDVDTQTVPQRSVTYSITGATNHRMLEVMQEWKEFMCSSVSCSWIPMKSGGAIQNAPGLMYHWVQNEEYPPNTANSISKEQLIAEGSV
jgi:hypothetical protein